ncbi:XRE family transcriptional regulator [Rhodosalinus sediminis]|uniref:XRE family transcriptional regulator n=1 Tax=Rhodosalinus sediminis TaxID=1940533 RepID=A0A3D9BZ72_9RHOB|nr:helix-turn-helix transcriptional regulator [Rhodosalinus sediminis]REC58860.1 XRE family transcriptional regulator [Rhodosalinus sediminis]
MTQIDTEVGRRIRERRVALSMSQTELGRRAGVKFQQIQKYESGANRVSASRLWAIAGALDVPVTYFFEGASDAAAPAPSGPGEELFRDPRAIRLVRDYLRLPEDQKKVVLEMVASMARRSVPSEEAELNA